MSRNKITIKDIAREAGVSAALVSFVMSNATSGTKYRVSSETSKRVLEVAARLNYKPNNSARALRSGKTGTVGVILSDIANPFFSEIARYLEDQAYNYGYNVIFASTDENPEKFNNAVKVLMNRGVDGLIVVPCAGAEDTIRGLSKSGVNIILLDRTIAGLESSSVVLDNRKAAESITAKLLERGARIIDMVSYSMNISSARERERGYIDAMSAAGLAERIHIERIAHNSYGTISEYVCAAKERGVEAFMIATNTLSLLVISEIYRNGFNIPSDFQVACFDRNPLYDVYGSGIIYVRQPIYDFAVNAMDLIMAHIRNGSTIDTKQIVLSPDIIG